MRQDDIPLKTSVRFGSWLIWGLEVYAWMTLIRIIVAWFVPKPYNSLLRLSFEVTDPGLNFLGNLIPPLIVGGMNLNDFSIMLTILVVLSARLLIRNMANKSSFD